MASEKDIEQSATGRKNFLTIGLLVIILLMFVFAVFGNRGILRILQAREQKQQLQQQLADLQLEQQKLRDEIERLRSDRNYWEKLARTRLGMVREGELIYHLPDEKKQDKRQTKE